MLIRREDYVLCDETVKKATLRTLAKPCEVYQNNVVPNLINYYISKCEKTLNA